MRLPGQSTSQHIGWCRTLSLENAVPNFSQGVLAWPGIVCVEFWYPWCCHCMSITVITFEGTSYTDRYGSLQKRKETQRESIRITQKTGGGMIWAALRYMVRLSGGFPLHF